ncbi:MAG: hypothetical protein CME70_03435 [Halobacteriovorax sp.]|nr:hypothetical protein [Halobacteriovorax sp.]MBK23037.1 hypothetical protein [Halobacteriovorax sp.]|tara:strand:- start:43562 stop:44347 length:786 start_codon:yes stop_codon:yes gene_type:complete
MKRIIISFLFPLFLVSCIETGELLGEVTVRGGSSSGGGAVVTVSESLVISLDDDLDDLETSSSPNPYDYMSDGEGYLHAPAEPDTLFCGYWETIQDDFTYCVFRFELPKDIPGNATITSASFSVRGKGHVTAGTGNWVQGTDYLEIFANNTDNSSTLLNYSDVEAVSGSRTSAIRWPSSGGLNWLDGQMTSPSLVSIINELKTNHNGLLSGSGITLWVASHQDYKIKAGLDDKEIKIADYGHAEFNTTLTIEYHYEKVISP